MLVLSTVSVSMNGPVIPRRWNNLDVTPVLGIVGETEPDSESDPGELTGVMVPPADAAS